MPAAAVLLCLWLSPRAAQAGLSDPPPRCRVTDLGSLLGGGGESHATGINDRGQVVGNSGGGAFLYGQGRARLLGAGGFSAAGINDNAQVAGTLFAGGRSRAAVWADGRVRELGDRPDTEAAGINDAGQIVGSGTNRLGRSHAFLLTPMEGGGNGGGPTPAVPLPPAAWAGLTTLAGIALAQAARGKPPAP